MTERSAHGPTGEVRRCPVVRCCWGRSRHLMRLHPAAGFMSTQPKQPALVILEHRPTLHPGVCIGARDFSAGPTGSRPHSFLKARLKARSTEDLCWPTPHRQDEGVDASAVPDGLRCTCAQHRYPLCTYAINIWERFGCYNLLPNSSRATVLHAPALIMTKRSTNSRSSRLYYENFLYLLAEMERVIDVVQIQLSTDQTNVILSRLGQIAQKLALARHGQDPGQLH